MLFKRSLSVEFYPEPLEAGGSPQQKMAPLFFTAITNPFGPTVTVLMVSGLSVTTNGIEHIPFLFAELPAPEVLLIVARNFASQARLEVIGWRYSGREIYEVVEHPFSPQVSKIGRLYLGSETSAFEIIKQLSQRVVGGCPTLILPSRLLDREQAHAICAAYLRQFADARQLFLSLQQFYGNPTERIKHDIEAAQNVAKQARSSDELLVLQQKWQEQQQQELTQEEASKMAEMMLSEGHIIAEIRAIQEAWSGSLNQLFPFPVPHVSQIQNRLKVILHGVVPLYFWIPQPKEQ